MSLPGFQLTESVFVEAERIHPDLMEPWSSRVAVLDDAADRQHTMRAGLAATFRQRYPMSDGKWPKANVEAVPAL